MIVLKKRMLKTWKILLLRGRCPHDFLLPSTEEAEELFQIALEIRELVIEEIHSERKRTGFFPESSL